jgi:hypothetical protein
MVRMRRATFCEATASLKGTSKKCGPPSRSIRPRTFRNTCIQRSLWFRQRQQLAQTHKCGHEGSRTACQEKR